MKIVNLREEGGLVLARIINLDARRVYYVVLLVSYPSF